MFMACNSPSPFTSSDRSPIKLNETEPAWYYKRNHSSLCARSDVSINVCRLNKLKPTALRNSEGYRVEPLSNFEIDSKDRWCWKLGGRTDNVCARGGSSSRQLAPSQLAAPPVTKNRMMDARAFFLLSSFLLRSEVYIQPPYYKSSIEKKMEKVGGIRERSQQRVWGIHTRRNRAIRKVTHEDGDMEDREIILKVQNTENAWNRRQGRARIEKKDEKDKVNTRAELS